MSAPPRHDAPDLAPDRRPDRSPDRTLARSALLLGILLWCAAVAAASALASGLVMAALDARTHTDDLDGLGVVLGLGLAAIGALALAASGPWAPGVLRGRRDHLAGRGAEALHQASFAAACAHGALAVLYGWASAHYVAPIVWLWLPGALAELVVVAAAATTATLARRAATAPAQRTTS